MDQDALLRALLQGNGPTPLMMNPGAAMSSLPGTGQISAPMLPQAAPPPALMAAPQIRPQGGMPMPMLPPSPANAQPPSDNPIAKGIASLGSPLGQLLGKPGETPTATNTLLQMLFGKGAQGGVSGILGMLK